MKDYERWMEEACALALRGRGHVEPNPRVGALALQAGRVVGRGWHGHYGGPHAEVEAVADARRQGAVPDTIVVTLEPCSTAQGPDKKTPPCTEFLVAQGIQKVVVGAADPDPRHKRVGLRALEEAGVEVVDGILASHCKSLNKPFEKWLGLDRPWTLAKYAMTLDGKTAAPTGESRWISGFQSRHATHVMRTRVDGVVVGYRTSRIDDPELTVRHVEGPQPVRIVVDPHAEIDDDSRLVATAREVPTWLLANANADPVRTGHLADLGVQILHVKPAERGRRLHLLEAWRELRRRGMKRLMVEGGGGLVAQLMSWGCIDQVQAYIAPKIIGGQFAPTPVAGAGRPFMAEAWRVEEMTWEASGDDLAVSGFIY